MAALLALSFLLFLSLSIALAWLWHNIHDCNLNRPNKVLKRYIIIQKNRCDICHFLFAVGTSIMIIFHFLAPLPLTASHVSLTEQNNSKETTVCSNMNAARVSNICAHTSIAISHFCFFFGFCASRMWWIIKEQDNGDVLVDGRLRWEKEMKITAVSFGISYHLLLHIGHRLTLNATCGLIKNSYTQTAVVSETFYMNVE